jgi:hypothetical protein
MAAIFLGGATEVVGVICSARCCAGGDAAAQHPCQKKEKDGPKAVLAN